MRERLSMFALVAAMGCGSPMPAPEPDAAASDAGQDAGPQVDAGPPALHGCGDADFLDRTAGAPDTRMIMVPTGTTTFDMPCMTIQAGQSVMFMWNFAQHPLAPGVAPGMPGTGTTPSPIVAQTTGSLYTVAFPTPGDYPFYCTLHHAGGMVGVVRVVP